MARQVFRQHSVHVCLVAPSCPVKTTIFTDCHWWWFMYTFVGLQLGACVCVLIARSCPAFCDPIDCSPPDSSIRGVFPGKNTGVGCPALLQGIFLTQGSNLGFPHCRQIESTGKPYTWFILSSGTFWSLISGYLSSSRSCVRFSQGNDWSWISLAFFPVYSRNPRLTFSALLLEVLLWALTLRTSFIWADANCSYSSSQFWFWVSWRITWLPISTAME